MDDGVDKGGKVICGVGDPCACPRFVLGEFAEEESARATPTSNSNNIPMIGLNLTAFIRHLLKRYNNMTTT